MAGFKEIMRWSEVEAPPCGGDKRLGVSIMFEIMHLLATLVLCRLHGMMEGGSYGKYIRRNGASDY
ncbi:MAG: hypothetical protein OET21_13390 [Desulfobacterales bacterium]|nr:hypothetical protein [Desulfobacterales bacterium]